MEDLNIEEIATGKAEARFPWWIVLFVVIATGFGLYYLIVGMWPDMTAKPTIVEDEQSLVRRAIDGMPAEEGTSPSFPLAVMIENSVDAWPVSGINSANLVWEAPAEAGIPRFLAIFGDGEDVSKIGPVRSARPYYVSWAEEFHALYAHVGGSPEALSIIPSRDVFDLNEFWNGSYFTRSSDRRAPHNVYTSTANLLSAVEKTNKSVPSYESWKYKDDLIKDERPINQEFTIKFSASPLYDINWNYNRDNNEYLRWQNRRVYSDSDGVQVSTKNVVVVEMKIAILDNEGRRRIENTGSGRAMVFRDGGVVIGEWSRPTSSDRTKFFVEGLEIEMNAGNTWIEVVPSLEAVEY